MMFHKMLLTIASAGPAIDVPPGSFQASIGERILGLVQFLMMFVATIMFFVSLLIILFDEKEPIKEEEKGKRKKSAKKTIIIAAVMFVVAFLMGILRSFLSR